jgi:hypothetical protein
LLKYFKKITGTNIYRNKTNFRGKKVFILNSGCWGNHIFQLATKRTIGYNFRLKNANWRDPSKLKNTDLHLLARVVANSFTG